MLPRSRGTDTAVRILVTGHDGYVGTLLMGMLRHTMHDAVGVDALFFQGCGLQGQAWGSTPGAFRVDIRSLPPSTLAGFDAVVHLASLSNDPLGSLHPRLTRAINQEASVRLARQARAEGVSRFLFASTCSVYGSAGSALVPEDAPARPVGPYGASKLEAETAIAGMADDAFSPTFLRPATVYGVSPRLRGDVAVNHMVGSALTRGDVRLNGDGAAWRPFLHVEDLCRAFLAVLEAPRHLVHNQVFNVVPEAENYRIRDVAELVAEAVPGCRVTFAKGNGEPVQNPGSYRVDGGKLAATLPHLVPRWTVAEGVRQLSLTLGRAGLTEEEFFGPRFMRLERIRSLLTRGVLDEELRWSSRSPAKAPTIWREDASWAGMAAPGLV